MYIIIIGGGRVGYYLAKALLGEGHEVLIVEKNARFCELITEEMGSVCYNGDGCEAAVLADIGTNRADMFVAVTGEDEDNLVACQVAKFKFKVPCTVARVRNPQNEALFRKLGIDVPVSATTIILEAIAKEVPTHPLTHLMTVTDRGLEVVDVKIPPAAPTIGKEIRSLYLPDETKLVLVIPKEDKPVLPTGDTVLRAGDQIIALIPREQEDELRATLTGI